MSIIYTVNAVKYLRDITKVSNTNEPSNEQSTYSSQELISQANEIKKLQQFFYTPEEISTKLGYSLERVEQLSTISNTSKEIQRLIEVKNFNVDDIIKILEKENDNSEKLKELKKLSNKKKRVRNGKKLYTKNTNKFEPIKENREHLINCLLPMVVKMTTNMMSDYSTNNEFTDALSAGVIGSIMATDIYIERYEKEGTQKAKLSTYAYSYIFKYIKEYLNSTQSILSHGPTKINDVRQIEVLSGNTIGNSDNTISGQFKEEYFYTSGDVNLMTTDSYENDYTQETNEISEKLFNCLNENEKEIIFMFFGIGYENKKEISEISKHFKMSSKDVENSLYNGLNSMKKVFKKSEHNDIINILKSSDLTKSIYWKRTFA